MRISFLAILFLLINGVCFSQSPLKLANTENTSNPEPYFPPSKNNSWEKIPADELRWNSYAITALISFLAQKNTKSFMIIINGKIAMEEYFNGHTAESTWQWNSAGKTLVSSVIGIAQQEGLLRLDDPVSKYLGNGWTSEPVEKEKLITIRHLLTMTSGLNDKQQANYRRKLTFIADAGTRWSYNNVFKILTTIIEKTSHQKYEDYFTKKIKNKIGMDGQWNIGKIFTIYHSNTRSMARFGILALNHGKWKQEQIIDKNYFSKSIKSSQELNLAYGYLWWLNGKSTYMIPGSQVVSTGHLIPNAPADTFAAMGAHDQRLYIIPSKKMIVVRMGETSNPAQPTFAVSNFDSELWAKINAITNTLK